MKFVCLKEKFSYALGVVEKIIGRNSSLPVLQNVHINAHKGRLILSTTDLELGIVVSVPAKIEKEGEFTVPARTLSSFISTVPEDRLEVELKKAELHIKAGEHAATLKGIEATEFPIIPEVESKHVFEVNSTEITTGLKQVYKAASISETRPEISGVYMRYSPSKILYLAATDSYRLGEKRVRGVKKQSDDVSVIIPIRTVSEVVRVLSDQLGDVKVTLDDHQIKLETSDVSMVSRVIEGAFPDYEKIIPDSHTTKVLMKRSDLINAVKIASLFASTINDVRLEVNPKEKSIQIGSANQSVGDNSSHVPAKIEGEAVKVAFNFRYLLDGLDAFETEAITLVCNGSNKPALISTDEDDSFRYVAMPIKDM